MNGSHLATAWHCRPVGLPVTKKALFVRNSSCRRFLIKNACMLLMGATFAGAQAQAKTLIIKESRATWRSLFEVQQASSEQSAEDEHEVASIYHALPSLTSSRLVIKDRAGNLLAKAYQKRFASNTVVSIYAGSSLLATVKQSSDLAPNGSGYAIFDHQGRELASGQKRARADHIDYGSYREAADGRYVFRGNDNAVVAEWQKLVDEADRGAQVFAISTQGNDQRISLALMSLATFEVRNTRVTAFASGLSMIIGATASLIVKLHELQEESNRAHALQAARRAREEERQRQWADRHREPVGVVNLNGDGYDGAGYNDRGFNRQGQHRNGSLFDAAGLDAQGNRRHGEQVLAHEQVIEDRQDASHMSGSELDEHRVGKACYIPGPNDYLGRQNLRDLKHFPTAAVVVNGKTLDLAAAGIHSSADFIAAIERRCMHYNARPQQQGREALQDTRQRLYRMIESPVLEHHNLGRGRPRQAFYSDVARNHILEAYIGSLATNMLTPSSFSFAGENGIDAGGLRKEFFRLFVGATKEKGLFKRGEQSARWSINSEFQAFGACTRSGAVATAGACFENVGSLFAKILLVEQDLLDIKLSHYLLERLLGNDVQSFVDLLAIYRLDDPAGFNTLMRTFSEDDFSVFMLSFEGGDANAPEVEVDNSNFYLYTFLDLSTKMATPEVASFLRGFHRLVPAGFLQLAGFKGNDLDLLLRGVQEVSLADLRSLVSFSYYRGPIEGWFWEAVSELQSASANQDFIVRLLMFWTSSPALPTDLQRNRLTVSVQSGRDPGALPASHTCFNKLDLSVYRSKAELKQKLQQAVDGAAGFAE